MFNFQFCTRCNKPIVNEENLRILRHIILESSIVTTFCLGFFALPIIGFASTGVVSGSIAAAWQSSIGNVVAGSLFATLQSMGTSVLYQLLFGAIGSLVGGGTGALACLLAHAEQLGFCTCNVDRATEITIRRTN